MYGRLKSLTGGVAAVLTLGFVFGVAFASGEYLTRWLLSGMLAVMRDVLSP